MDHCFKLIIILFLYSSTSSAAVTASAISNAFQPTSVFEALLDKPTNLSRDFSVSFKNGAGVTAKRLVSIPKSVVGNVLKSRAFTPWGIGIAVAIESSGYVMDLLTGEVQSPAINTGLTGANGTCYNGFSSYSTDYGTCISSFDLSTHFLGWAGLVLYNVRNGSTAGGSFCCDGYFQPFDPSLSGTALPTPSSNIDDTVLYGTLNNSLTSSEIASLLNDPETGRPYSSISEIQNQANALTASYNSSLQDDSSSSVSSTDTTVQNSAGLDPNADPTVSTTSDTSHSFSTDPVTGVETDTATTTDTTTSTDPSTDTVTTTTTTTTTNTATSKTPDGFTSPEESDLCTDNPKALACQQLGEMSKDPEVKTLNVPFTYDPVLLSSNSSCPSPTSFTVNGTTMSIPTAPRCSFARSLNPIVLSVCSIIGIYILTGGVKNG